MADTTGSITIEYEKLHPYGIEGALGISKGRRAQMFEIQGRKILILLCAHFWYSSSFVQESSLPDVVLVRSEAPA